MSELTYLTLTINADEGVPQAFRLAFNNNLYTFSFYANLPEAVVREAPLDAVFDLSKNPSPVDKDEAPGFLVMKVAREGGESPQVIFQRKLVSNLELYAEELAFKFGTIHLARGNLNGVEPLGSKIEASVAARWLL